MGQAPNSSNNLCPRRIQNKIAKKNPINMLLSLPYMPTFSLAKYQIIVFCHYPMNLNTFFITLTICNSIVTETGTASSVSLGTSHCLKIQELDCQKWTTLSAEVQNYHYPWSFSTSLMLKILYFSMHQKPFMNLQQINQSSWDGKAQIDITKFNWKLFCTTKG